MPLAVPHGGAKQGGGWGGIRGKLKRFKRVALRCEKTDISCSAIISFACGPMLVKSVHTA
jgi:hypothetical protein